MPASRKTKKRLDVLLVERGLAASRTKAQAMILAGVVKGNGHTRLKPGSVLDEDAAIHVVAAPRFVSRGGEKLAGALEDLRLSVEGRICLDAGCSTGGFTDCLLQHGAAKVFAVDVSIAQLDARLRRDSRVRAIEGNARHLSRKEIADPVDFVVADLSFISVAKVLPALLDVAAPRAEFLILVKPQFELERKDVGRGGVVRSAALQEKAVARVREAAGQAGLVVEKVVPSRVKGAEGNQEFFLYARRAAKTGRAME
jgi:23S rRNA (cytidine1920-2'-O)/16S rRNA (cytidine1409-2'-O)-methyltransferase